MLRYLHIVFGLLKAPAGLRGKTRNNRKAVLALATALSALNATAWAQAAEELPLVGPAFEIATEAYQAFEHGDYSTAATRAREAIRQRPDVDRLKRLLVDALAAAGELEEASRVASSFIDTGTQDPDLIQLRDRLRERIAQKPVIAAAATAHAAAEAAYAAHAKANYVEAIAKAREAIGKSPNEVRFKRLLVEMLVAAGKFEEATKVLSGFSRIDEQDPELVRLQGLVRNSPAQRRDNAGFEIADAGYKAFARKDYATAIERARKAVELEPNNRMYRALLINSLSAGARHGEAEQAASAALKKNSQDSKILALRGYARLALGRHASAADDFTTALRSRKSPAADRRAWRLALVDAALTAKQPQRALDALAGLKGERSYAVASRLGFVLLALGQRENALEAFTEAAAQAAAPKDRTLVTNAEIGLLVDLERKDEARRRFAEAQPALSSLGNLDLAYLASRVGDDLKAHESFGKADAAGEIKGLGLVDAAYVAKRLHKNNEAVKLFKSAIDAEASGDIALEPQYLFGFRREMSELERSWGFHSSLSYGAVGVMPSAPFTPSLQSGNVLQAGTEIYWRPPSIGYRNGSVFEIFGRAFQTLSDETKGPVGLSTTQGSVGARWKPFGGINLVFEVSRLFPIGKDARADVLLRAGYSDGGGTDLRVDVPDWWTWQIYGDIGYYVEEAQTIGVFEARAGRSFRLDGISNRLVLTPFLAVGGGYDNLLAIPEAIGAGPGLNLRYWFRESKYMAPMSSLDVNVQYRFKLTGDDRAQGVFAGITLSY